jgi:hypothetical protein
MRGQKPLLWGAGDRPWAGLGTTRLVWLLLLTRRFQFLDLSFLENHFAG